jgi:glutathione S-transferase
MTKVERIKLFHYPATRSARVKWMLHEILGDAFDVERVSLYDAEQYDPAYMAMNPNHNVPTLQLTLADGSTRYMLESGAMVAWLADAFPERGLAPPAGGGLCPRRADYEQMLHFASGWMDMMLWQIRIHEHVLPEAERDPRTVARYRKKFADEVEPQLLARLTQSAFICGDAFSAADCMIGHCVLWARAYGLCQQPEFLDYVRRLAARPAFLQAVADAAEFQPAVPADKPLLPLRFTG